MKTQFLWQSRSRHTKVAPVTVVKPHWLEPLERGKALVLYTRVSSSLFHSMTMNSLYYQLSCIIGVQDTGAMHTTGSVINGSLDWTSESSCECQYINMMMSHDIECHKVEEIGHFTESSPCHHRFFELKIDTECNNASTFSPYSPLAIFCRGIILGVEPAEMGPLSNTRKTSETGKPYSEYPCYICVQPGRLCLC